MKKIIISVVALVVCLSADTLNKSIKKASIKTDTQFSKRYIQFEKEYQELQKFFNNNQVGVKHRKIILKHEELSNQLDSLDIRAISEAEI